MSEKKAEKFPTYKGKPLVRCGDTIYYGSMKDKYVIKMDIKSKKKVKDLEVADRGGSTSDVHRRRCSQPQANRPFQRAEGTVSCFGYCFGLAVPGPGRG